MMTRIGDPHTVDEARLARDRAEIAAAWDTLAVALDTGSVSESQFAWVMRHAPDDDAAPLMISMFAAAMRRWLETPGDIGADVETMRTWPCRCGEGRGFVETPDPDQPGRTWSRPCELCAPGPYRRWRDHWSDPEHSCEECSRPRRTRHLAEEREDDRTGDHDRTLDGLI